MSWPWQSLLKNTTKQNYTFHMYLFVSRCLDLDKVCSKIRQSKVIYFICIYLSVCVLTSVKYVQKYDKTKLYISYVFIVCMCLDLDKICRHVYMFLLYFCKRFYIVWSQCEFQPLRNISATNDHGYVPFVVITIPSFPHSIYIWNQFDNTIFSISRIFCFTIFASLIVRCFWSYKTY